MKSTFTGNFFALVITVFMVMFNFIASNILLGAPISPTIKAIITSILVYAIPIYIYFFITKSNPIETLRLKKISLWNIAVIVGISVAIQPLLMLISALSTLVFPNNVTRILEGFSVVPLWQTLTLAAVIPAFMEELTFRGIVAYNYENTGIVKTTLVTAFIFAMAHMDGQQFFYAFFMGIVFSYFVYKTGSLFASIISHFTVNGLQTTLAHTLYSTHPTENVVTQTTLADILPVANFTLLVAPVLIFLFYIFHKKNVGIIFLAEKTEEKLINSPLIIYITIFLISTVGNFLWG